MKKLIFSLMLWALPLWANAGATAEDKDFRAAFNKFRDGFYPQAETGFSNFVAHYTISTNRLLAILLQARCQIYQSNYVSATNLLQKQFPAVGDLAADYIFRIAEAHLDNGDFQPAADGFANLAKNFPNSPLRLDAAVDEATAYSKLDKWPQVIALLREPSGAFQTSARADAKNESAVRGFLLLSTAYFRQGQFAEGEKVLQGIDPAPLLPELKWQRQYLLVRCQLAGGQSDQALVNGTNLIDIAFSPRDKADSVLLLGEIHEKLGAWPEALQAYTNNLADPAVPADIERQSLVKAVGVILEQGDTGQAVELLEKFIAQRPHSPALDFVRVSLGELYLKAGTNLLQSAITNLDRAIQDFPDSPLRGKAYLERGWCSWEQGKYAEAGTNFLEAVNRLPPSEDQAVARFKLADALYAEGDFGGAVTNYNLLRQQYADVESVTNRLFAQALYQVIQASLKRNDSATAWAAAREILSSYPDSHFGGHGLSLLGEDSNRGARQAFAGLIKQFPNASLEPDVQFAMARFYDQEGDATNAAAAYDRWVTKFPGHPLLPRVEFSRALAYAKSGRQTNALMLLTNFVAQFSSNSLAPLAQNWVGDYYFNHEDYEHADLAYQEVYLKFPNAGDIAYRARLMAGRSAYARQDTKQAHADFYDLVKDTNAPWPIAAEGYFALGDTSLEQFRETTNDTPLKEAITFFSMLTNGPSTNAMAPLAFGRLGDCYLQWADLKSDPSVYTNAAEMYQAVLAFSPTNVAAHGQAEIGLGRVAERQGQMDAALTHYCQPLYNEDPFWVKEAGVYAARLCEAQQRWDLAIKVYRRVEEKVPSLRSTMEKKIVSASAHTKTGAN